MSVPNSMRKRCLAAILAIFLPILAVFVPVRAGLASDPVRVPTAWMEEHETFLIWYAKQKGWDREVGLDIEIRYYNSGADMLKAMPAREWVFAGMGAVPATLANLRHGTIVIANGNDETMTNGVVVRPDSEIARTRGKMNGYPEILGSADTVRDKTFLVTAPSSAHYALASWLEVLGLKESDIVIKNKEQSQALADFENNIGDGMALWAPQLFLALEKGAVLAGDLRQCRKGNPIVLVADQQYAAANPEITAKFLGLYMRSVNMLQNEKPEDLVAEYRRFFLEWAGKEYSEALALQDLIKHPVFNLDEQLAMFDDSKGQSQAQSWQAEVARFLIGTGRISPEEGEKVKDGKYATNRYLKQVPTPIPSYR